MIQLRALLRANVGLENLQVLFPMVAKISELDEALELMARAHRELLEEGQVVAKPKVGVMIEVPSAVFLTKAIATRVDFLSIGTNDLAQYVLAADRTNARVTTPDDTLHPAVLNAINMVICDDPGSKHACECVRRNGRGSRWRSRTSRHGRRCPEHGPR